MNEGYIRHTSSKQRDDAIFTQSVSVTAQQSSAKDPITALNTLVTDQIKTPSTISNPGQYNVSADKGQTSANIQQNQNTVGGLNQQATQNRAAITQAVTQLQRDVYAAAKAANVNAGDLSPNSGAGMALATHAALAATGAGALATIVVSAVEVMGHKEKVSPSVIESRIQDKMLSAGHQQSQSAFTTNASQPLKPFKADYQAYFNAGGTVKQILDMNQTSRRRFRSRG